MSKFPGPLIPIILASFFLDIPYMRKFWLGKKLANLVNHELFAKSLIFLTNIHRNKENVYGICMNCCLFVKFFLANT